MLDREMYSEAEAARLLGVAQSTLNYWLEGGVRRGKSYRPIIRTEATGGRSPVTWAEFVEAGLLPGSAAGTSCSKRRNEADSIPSSGS